MAGVYCQRHPERTVLYRVLFHYFERFLEEYEHRFEKEYGYLRPVIHEVVGKYLDCSNPKCGFARIRCPDCGTERFTEAKILASEWLQTYDSWLKKVPMSAI